MKFEKDVMEVALYYRSDKLEEIIYHRLMQGKDAIDIPSKIEGTISKFNLDVYREVGRLKTAIELGSMIFLDGDTYGTSGDVVESFEVLNYLDLKPEEEL